MRRKSNTLLRAFAFSNEPPSGKDFIVLSRDFSILFIIRPALSKSGLICPSSNKRLSAICSGVAPRYLVKTTASAIPFWNPDRSSPGAFNVRLSTRSSKYLPAASIFFLVPAAISLETFASPIVLPAADNPPWIAPPTTPASAKTFRRFPARARDFSVPSRPMRSVV